jgi:hypothetical protein
MRAKFYCQGSSVRERALCPAACVYILCVYNNFILDGYAAFMYEIKNIRQRNMLSVCARQRERERVREKERRLPILHYVGGPPAQRMQIRQGLNIMIMDLGKTFSVKV